MITPREQRQIRLKNDYNEMANIKGPIIQWRGIKGEPPYLEAYELSIMIRTVISDSPLYRNEHNLRLELPADYPRSPPEVYMNTKPQPFHPNWFTSGKWCHGFWDISEGLGHFVIRMIRTLQYDLEITNPNSPANVAARDWFLIPKNAKLFPCDKTVLPDPTTCVETPKKKFLMHSAPNEKKFVIQ